MKLMMVTASSRLSVIHRPRKLPGTMICDESESKASGFAEVITASACKRFTGWVETHCPRSYRRDEPVCPAPRSPELRWEEAGKGARRPDMPLRDAGTRRG